MTDAEDDIPLIEAILCISHRLPEPPPQAASDPPNDASVRSPEVAKSNPPARVEPKRRRTEPIGMAAGGALQENGDFDPV